MAKFLIPLKDYERIYKTIYSVLMSEKADITKCCLHFSLFGTFILKSHYKLDAKSVVGIAGHRVGNDIKNVLMFAEVIETRLACTENGFHSWIEVDGWLIDFMAPLFPKLMIAGGCQEPCEAKMMQKRLDRKVNSPNVLKSLGDFYIGPSTKYTRELTEHFYSTASEFSWIIKYLE